MTRETKAHINNILLANVLKDCHIEECDECEWAKLKLNIEMRFDEFYEYLKISLYPQEYLGNC